VDAAAVRAGVGWALRARSTHAHVDPPSAGELRLLRDVLDPGHLYLKG
jgi:glutaconate CoA-transferase subunit B